MPRIVEIAVPPDQTDTLIEALESREDVLGLRLQQGTSVQPPGDIITISTTNRSMQTLVRLLDEHGVGSDSGTSMTTSEPVSLIVPSATERLAHDTNEATWEEMESVTAKESNTTANALVVMGISGVLAAIGLATNALHLVVGAMLIAPGFEPIVRFSMGVVSRSMGWRRGLMQTLQTYAALVLGAAITAGALRLLGTSPLGQEDTYLPSSVLVTYWTSFSATTFMVSVTAGVAGAILVASNRAVLTAGVMVALALVPGATLVASGLVGG
ncbi:MAG TPA: DUF389 domain-containing protein, partial [Thermomicrobiales bacterium]|nr:DUF389 domain-containing protein [Thermomicrobiales bacterium]